MDEFIVRRRKLIKKRGLDQRSITSPMRRVACLLLC